MTEAAAALDDDKNWDGGHYELAIDLGTTDRLQEAVDALRRAARIDGSVTRDGRAVACTVAALAEHGQLCGTVRLPGGARVVCSVYATRYDDGTTCLDLTLPLGALARTDRRIGGFPFGGSGGAGSLAWRESLDTWLAAVGMAVYDEVPFRLAAIGFELDAEMEVPAGDRWESYLVPEDDGLRYLPANR